MRTYIKAISGFVLSLHLRIKFSRLTFKRGAILVIGGPALVMWVTPTQEEIFQVCNLATA
jgi:hypothetical protein